MGRSEGGIGTGVTAHKVINNNVVISIDPSGRERILMGRGLGFGLRPTDTIDPAAVEKTFVLDDGDAGQHELRMLRDTPYRVVEAVTRATDAAERELGRALGRHFTISVIDHIQFVLERLDKGVRIPSAAMPQLRVLHPRESAAAENMAAAIAASLERTLPEEEGVFLTMHVLNATRDEVDGTAAELFRRVRGVTQVVETGLGVGLDPDQPDYARFMMHVQFLLRRVASRALLRGEDSSFFDFARRSYPAAFAIAQDVDAYLRGEDGSGLTDEEILYLTVHIERLARAAESPPSTDS